MIHSFFKELEAIAKVAQKADFENPNEDSDEDQVEAESKNEMTPGVSDYCKVDINVEQLDDSTGDDVAF